MTPQLGVFLKLPVEGQVKTRLALTLGARAATEAYRWMTEAVLSQTQSQQWQRTLFGEPRHPLVSYKAAFPDETIALQEGEDLGERLTEGFSKLLERGPAVVIGTDCVDLDESLIETAFEQLEKSDLVLGPARDGGYTLIGLSRPEPRLFEGIPWSTRNVLKATIEKAQSLDLSFSLLRELTDIDTEDELKVVRPEWWEKLQNEQR